MNSTKSNQLGKNLSPINACAFSIGTSIGWGSMVITGNTYLTQAGPLGSILGIIIGTLVMLVVARCYSYLMTRFPDAGGSYVFVRNVFGYDHGFLTAWFLALTYLSILWANATSLPLFARIFMGDMFRFGKLYSVFGYEVYLGEALLSIVAMALIAWLCIANKKAAALIMTVFVFVFTLCIAVVFIGSLFGKSVPFTPAFVPDSSVIAQVAKITIISPWAFIGFECIAHGSEEMKFSSSSFANVFRISVIVTAVLYIMVVVMSVTAYPDRYSSWLEYVRDIGNLSGIEALPPFYAAYSHMGNAGIILLMAALLALVITSLIGNITAVSRLVYALGRDGILPQSYMTLNVGGSPANAIKLVVFISVFIPFLGRTPIGWIVDVTTIGATLIYGFVSISAGKLANSQKDRKERTFGFAGLVLMIIFAFYMFLPNLMSTGTMEKETYFLFVVWSILGFFVFSNVLWKDTSSRFGRSVIVWVSLLALILFVSLVWMRQSMITSSEKVLSDIHSYYSENDDGSDIRKNDVEFVEQQIRSLEAANTRTIVMAMSMFMLSMGVMIWNYSYMNKKTKLSEEIANRDPMTGVKSKHAYMTCEQEYDKKISDNTVEEFAVVVCDVNGLKYINDTFGHEAGDGYIRAASKVICETFKHSPVFRIGGDEFVVIASGIDHSNLSNLMNELNTMMEQNVGTDKVVVAAGVSEYIEGDDVNLHTVFARADGLMYERKQYLKNLAAKTH